MPDSRVFICLANSRKQPGRCIAGVSTDSESPEWTRPVSDRPHREVSEEERQYDDGSDPRVLDIIEVPVVRHQPDAYQSENWLLDSAQYWRRLGRATWDDLEALESDREPLWIEPEVSSTRHGQNDRVTIEFAETLDDSLRLIHVDDLRLRVFAPSADFGNSKRRVLASFTYLDTIYSLWVSDPRIERDYLALANDVYVLGEAFLTISLAERHVDGYCYKMVAGVIDSEYAEGV